MLVPPPGVGLSEGAVSSSDKPLEVWAALEHVSPEKSREGVAEDAFDLLPPAVYRGLTLVAEDLRDLALGLLLEQESEDVLEVGLKFFDLREEGVEQGRVHGHRLDVDGIVRHGVCKRVSIAVGVLSWLVERVDVALAGITAGNTVAVALPDTALRAVAPAVVAHALHVRPDGSVVLAVDLVGYGDEHVVLPQIDLLLAFLVVLFLGVHLCAPSVSDGVRRMRRHRKGAEQPDGHSVSWLQRPLWLNAAVPLF